MFPHPVLFFEQKDPKVARDIFKASVNRVEIETHSYCNRRCDYCPNVVGDRLGENIRMPEAMYSRMIDDLASIDFEHNVVFASYNEPLYDRIVLDRVAEARQKLPRARLMTFTNGDYLTRDYVDELADAGLNYIHVSIHTKRGEHYTPLYVLNRMSEISHRAGLRLVIDSAKTSQIMAHFVHPRIEIQTSATDFQVLGQDRGGLLPHLSAKTVRTAPCSRVFNHFHVGYNGNVVPCCHVRSDMELHKGYVIGNLGDAESIFQIWAGAKGAAWRRGLSSDLPKSGPCKHCTSADFSDYPKERQQVIDAHKKYVHDPARAKQGTATPDAKTEARA